MAPPNLAQPGQHSDRRRVRHGGRLATSGFQVVLALDLLGQESRPSPDPSEGSRANPTDGAGERLGRASDPWGTFLNWAPQLDEHPGSRYLQKRPPAPDALQRWLAVLRNHRDCLAGMDFFTVPIATFQFLWVFFVLHHGRRQVLHFAVTDHLGAQWLVQQLREAFPFHRAPPLRALRSGRKGMVQRCLRSCRPGGQVGADCRPGALAKRRGRTLSGFGPPGVAGLSGGIQSGATAQALGRLRPVLPRGALPLDPGEGHARRSGRDHQTFGERWCGGAGAGRRLAAPLRVA